MELGSSTHCCAACPGNAAREFRICPLRGLVVAVLLAFIAGASAAETPTPAGAIAQGTPSYEITSAVIAGGGISRAENPCFELAGTSGQPVAGASSNASYALYAGFWGGAVFDDTIFRNTFEACTP